MTKRALWVAGLVAVWAAQGCSATTILDTDADVDGARPDVGRDDAAADTGTPATCTSSAMCDDGAFCNGAETCVSGRCTAGTAPCTTGQTCDEVADACSSGCGAVEDADHDGHRSSACAGGDDCDDNDANRYPGNREACDPAGHDEDCDPTTYGFRDADGDGEPDAHCCNGATCGTDCDDMRPTVHPSATESCNGIDDDCDAATDEGVQRTFYADTDGDGFGDPNATTMLACFVPTGYSESNTDCDDTNRDINPSHGEVCDTSGVDENCDGVANPPSLCNCTGTASRPCTAPGACASGTESCSGGMWGACSIAPVTETCNNVDDDCNGIVDDGLRVNCFPDGDNDGFSAMGAMMSMQCFTATRPLVGGCPLNFTDLAPMSPNIDCNDSAARISPAGTEVCNGIDDDCSGAPDETLTVLCYTDEDNDTFPPSGAGSFAMCPQVARAAVGGCPALLTNRIPMTGAIDCDDAIAIRNPGAAETCNMVDDNCNGSVDEGVSTLCYADADRDTFAAAGATTMMACGLCGVGWTSRAPVAGNVDCDDTRAGVFPGAVDTCDAASLDEDCDGTPNDPPGGCACTGTMTRQCCAGRGVQSCSSGQWAPCSISAQPEVCNSMDDDCDGVVDNGVRATCYADVDLDGYAATGAATMQACLPCSGNPGGWTDRAPTGTSVDCNDTNPNVHPTAPDPCNGIDDDCDGVTDPGYCRIGASCYANGVANPASPDCQYCNTATPSVWSSRTNGTSCDDANMATCTTCQSGACTTIPGGNCADALTCTADLCDVGPSCSHPLVANTCLIAGVCYANGASNPANPCQSCQPSVSTTSFTNRTDNSSCGCGGGVAQICCGGSCVSAGTSTHCGSCSTTCTRGCFLGPTNGAACGDACSRSSYRCCSGPVGTICDCI